MKLVSGEKFGLFKFNYMKVSLSPASPRWWALGHLGTWALGQALDAGVGAAADGTRVNDTLCVSDIIITIMVQIASERHPGCEQCSNPASPQLSHLLLCMSW